MIYVPFSLAALPSEMPRKLVSLLAECWSQRPLSRPTFPTILKKINKAKPSKKSVLDCMMEAVEQYVGHLEEKVSLRLTRLRQERFKSY